MSGTETITCPEMADYVRKWPGLSDVYPIILAMQQWSLSWRNPKSLKRVGYQYKPVTTMKSLLLFISLTYMSWGAMSTPPDTTVRDQLNPVEANSYEIFPVDITEVVRAQHGDLNATEMQAAIQKLLVNDYVTAFKSLEEMDNDCLGDCRTYTVTCHCGTVISYQYCPCPWFPDPAEQMFSLCNQACDEM